RPVEEQVVVGGIDAVEPVNEAANPTIGCFLDIVRSLRMQASQHLCQCFFQSVRLRAQGTDISRVLRRIEQFERLSSIQKRSDHYLEVLGAQQREHAQSQRTNQILLLRLLAQGSIRKPRYVEGYTEAIAEQKVLLNSVAGL